MKQLVNNVWWILVGVGCFGILSGWIDGPATYQGGYYSAGTAPDTFVWRKVQTFPSMATCQEWANRTTVGSFVVECRKS